MLTIRDMTPADRVAYGEMARDFYGGEATLFSLREDMLDATMAEACSTSPRTRLLMLELDGACAGYGNLSFAFSTGAGGLVCWIEEIYIKPALRGRGLGKQYLQWVLDTYRPTCRRFRLEVCPDNPSAARLYESLGFKVLAYQQMMMGE